ncbi:MAG TPA: hypothetical protein DCM08_03355 [Microscillaceae bacterium]|nr:hypothetical protein [Microscillaceae bacterium]
MMSQTLKKYWVIREDQWGTQSLMIREGKEVYEMYEDRSGGSDGEVFLGDLATFAANYQQHDNPVYVEAAAYILSHYL